MFRAVALPLLEFWEVLNEPLHVLNRLEIGSRVLLLEIVLDMFLDLLSDLTVVFEHNVAEELIVMLTDDDLGLFKGVVIETDSVICDFKKFVDH